MIDIPPLHSQILTALEKCPHIARRDLHLKTDRGRVTLHGVVETYYQKQMAQEAVRHIDGVHEVTNEVEVVWP